MESFVWSGVKEILASAGFEVAWSGDLPNELGDDAVLAQAHEEGWGLI